MMVKIDRISLEKKGLNKFFSPNESRIMEMLWDGVELTSVNIQNECTDLSLACVAGTLDRLVKAGFVVRRLDEEAERVRYIYTAAQTRDETGVLLAERMLDSLSETFGHHVVASLGKTKRWGKKK